MNSINPIWLIAFSIVIACLPILAGLATAYLKVSIVLGMVRSALGTQNVPSSLVIMALSMAMTMFIMGPVFVETAAIGEKIPFQEIIKSPDLGSLKKIQPMLEPWRNFMNLHSGSREKQVLSSIDQSSQGEENGTSRNSSGTSDKERLVSYRVLLPAFLLTELKEAFAMGFIILLPFLVVDLIVANILVGMGMFMVSPVMISLPLKLILFVLSDGWLILTKGLISSYM